MKNVTPLKSDSSSGESLFSAWGCFIGILLGLVATLVIGRWYSNAIAAGITGYIIGALIDRSRR
ncbi:hypothetical protein [Rariglobus hedericola]|uniref:Uncharacterized protein n=1 Tax=Rariglobus hedericola TaxID=2597822 RepID=A0A556QQI9_9BACT|nr:hypothetical protein [Rariglobus hedericola]TSJ78908.1 hypothetical protein FPL22_06280 [Rariglobus hedericola]